MFSATASQPVGPVNSVFGFHVILVDNIEPGSEATLADVRTSVETLLRSEKAIDLVYDRVNELEDILGTGATLDEAARKIGVMAGKIDEMDANGRNIDGMPITDSIGDLATDSLFLQQAWNLEIDEISPVIESAQNSFFVVKPVMEADARPRVLEEVKTRLIADWTKIQALAKAKADAQTALQNPQKTFEEINKTAAFSRTGAGLDNEAAGLIANTAFGQDPSKTSLVETGDSVILVRTEEVFEAEQDALSELSDGLQRSLDGLVQTDIASAVVITLSETHGLELNAAGVQQILMGQTVR